jgi:hypothetical protein
VAEPVYIEKSAVFDDERIYRYALTRAWGFGPRVLWIMLNPSTADESVLDPTLRRCLGFAQSWGFDGFEVCNAYALRSTDPRALKVHPHPIGPDNDVAIEYLAERAGRVIVGWGSNCEIAREREVAKILAGVGVRPMCLGTTGKGAPRHPLYLRADSLAFPWEPEC